jgi:hypothetical protein
MDIRPPYGPMSVAVTLAFSGCETGFCAVLDVEIEAVAVSEVSAAKTLTVMRMGVDLPAMENRPRSDRF